jgi:hypothetical protein
LDNSGPVTVTADKPAQRDLTLRKASDVSLQMSTAEWLMSFPGTDQQKRQLLNCPMCHTLERIARSRYTAEQWRRSRMMVGPVLDIYNAGNAATILSRITQLGPTYGNAASIQRGRLIRAGVNVNF